MVIDTQENALKQFSMISIPTMSIHSLHPTPTINVTSDSYDNSYKAPDERLQEEQLIFIQQKRQS